MPQEHEVTAAIDDAAEHIKRARALATRAKTPEQWLEVHHALDMASVDLGIAMRRSDPYAR